MKSIKSLLLATTILVGSMAMAQEKEAHSDVAKDEKVTMHRPHDMLPDLTDVQKEEMKAIKMETQKQMQPLKNQLGEKKAKMQTLTTAENVDMAQVEALIDEMSDIRAEMMKIKARQKQKIRSQLTEEQRLAFDSMKKEHRGHKQHHKEHKNKVR